MSRCLPNQAPSTPNVQCEDQTRIALFKAMQVAAGVALPQDVTLKIAAECALPPHGQFLTEPERGRLGTLSRSRTGDQRRRLPKCRVPPSRGQLLYDL
jgi:hypothetical protein